jgi:hypothetical protein
LTTLSSRRTRVVITASTRCSGRELIGRPFGGGSARPTIQVVHEWVPTMTASQIFLTGCRLGCRRRHPCPAVGSSFAPGRQLAAYAGRQLFASARSGRLGRGCHGRGKQLDRWTRISRILRTRLAVGVVFQSCCGPRAPHPMSSRSSEAPPGGWSDVPCLHR